MRLELSEQQVKWLGDQNVRLLGGAKAQEHSLGAREPALPFSSRTLTLHAFWLAPIRQAAGDQAKGLTDRPSASSNSPSNLHLAKMCFMGSHENFPFPRLYILVGFPSPAASIEFAVFLRKLSKSPRINCIHMILIDYISDQFCSQILSKV